MKDLNFNSVILDEFSEIESGVKSAKHPFHMFCISTIRNQYPENRNVILRSFSTSSFSFSFNTDIRSQKINDLKSNKKVSALFYDEKRKVQLRVKAIAAINYDDSISLKAWNNMHKDSRICYGGEYSPSEKLKNYSPNLPENHLDGLSEKLNRFAYENFSVIRLNIISIDWLKLNYLGHQRILFEIYNNKISACWIAP
tara:strand:- start:634 stop:1227 length:594 start_codon:yes stop_codon:yes gene_type:complete